MNHLKLFILLSFAVFGGAFLIDRQLSVTVFGQTAPAAPTGVSASDGVYADRVSINWDTMRGATTYKIFRNTVNNSATAVEIASTPANFYQDMTAVQATAYFYWVRALNGTTASAFSAADAGQSAIGSANATQLDPPNAPTGNPITAAKAALGKALFWDEQLSSTNTVACGTCHRSASGGGDPRTITGSLRSTNPGPDGVFGGADDILGSPGVPLNNADGTYGFSPIFKFREQVTGRKAPTYLNAGYTRQGIFWDGRANDIFRDQLTNAVLLTEWGGLESQSAGPPANSAEMAHQNRNWSQVASKIAGVKPLALAQNVPVSLQTWVDGRTYPQLFEEAFGTPDVTPARISMAIATHERVLFSDRTPLELADAGITPLTPSEQNGRLIFESASCSICHAGPLLSDNNFHNIGVRPGSEDAGRNIVTQDPDDVARFKTPSLRNVELRAPYMHNGRFATLEDVVEFYNRGGDFDAPNVSHDLIRPLNLFPQEKADLVAFMKRPLTDPRVRNELPPFDRPQLFTESSRVPVITGTGVAGVGGQIPAAVAIEPPLVGNPSFTVGVSNAAQGANVVLVINSTDPGTASIPSAGSFLRQTTSTNGSGAASVSVAIPDNAALVGQTFFGRWYITDAASSSGFSVSQAFRFTVFGQASAPARAGFVDFDGDRKTDISIFRESDGSWWYTRSSDNGFRVYSFGAGTDKLAPGDWTGDGKTDIAIWRPASGEWFVQRSEDGTYFSFPFGASGDVAVPGDYDGDGKTDAAVFRPSTTTWFILKSGGGTSIISFGATGDKPVPSDYDGDGKADIAIYRPNGATGSEWWINRSSTGQTIALQFGLPTDKSVPGDYTGDGKSDIAFFRPSTGFWFILRSEDFSFFSFPFGAAGDLAAPGDYDGDGKFDAAVFRPSAATWYLNRSTAGIGIFQFGATTDRPVPNAFVP